MLDAATTPALAFHNPDVAAAYDRSQVPCGCRPTPWYVVATHPRAERRAYTALHRRGFDAYLPLIWVRWRDRTWHNNALFPGYLFVALDLAKPWHPVTYAPGVYHLLAIDGKPQPCARGAVEALRAVEPFAASEHQLAPGMPCSLVLGPLRGMSGVVVDLDHATDTATVAILMLGQLRTIAVDLDCLAPREDL